MTATRTALIIGAGPAGLTAAYELLKRSDIKPIVIEATEHIGGISRTARYKGNHIDLGGHRFFSKSDRVMDWWLEHMPMQGAPAIDDRELGREIPLSDKSDAPDPEKSNLVMLFRNRLSRIYYLRKFFDYPVSLNVKTVLNLGPLRIGRIGMSYLKARALPIRNEKNLEDFFINRFGRELYLTFFKDYTEKVWGVSCTDIQPEWGAQRIKGLSITKALLHAAKQLVARDTDISQKDVETSLIERFLYPKYGPGQMWETVADKVRSLGGDVHMNQEAVKLDLSDKNIQSVTTRNTVTGETTQYEADFVFSTMAVKDLIESIEGQIPDKVRTISSGLSYRDFMTVGLLLNRLKIRNETAIKTVGNLVPDNWIYIQEREVKLGRLQVFNNWSPYLVADSGKVWIGLEYFCTEGDELWSMADDKMKAFAIKELASIDIIDPAEVLDGVVIRQKKTYPGYFGSYDQFDTVRAFTDSISNLFLVGRNGMHRYNNQDHSMLTAMTAVDNILVGQTDKSNIWDVNTEQEYHETNDETS